MSLPARCPRSPSGALHAPSASRLPPSLPSASLPVSPVTSISQGRRWTPQVQEEPMLKQRGSSTSGWGVAQASGPQGHVRRRRRAPVGTRLEMLQVTETPCSPPTAASTLPAMLSAGMPGGERTWPGLSVSPNLRLVGCDAAVRPALLTPRRGPDEASTRATP